MRIDVDQDVFRPVVVRLESKHDLDSLRKAVNTALEVAGTQRMIGRFSAYERGTLASLRATLEGIAVR